MPKGFAGVREAKADIDSRAASGGGDGRLWFKLPNDGDQATVRFLEQGEDIEWAWMHKLPPRGKQRFGDDIPCRDQDRNGEPCPSCESGDSIDNDTMARDRAFSGFVNLIWRDAPVYPMAEGQKWPDRSKPPVGTKDQIAVWNAGITVFDELGGKDMTYRGLCSRDFVVTRHGTGMKTRYSIEPFLVDGESKAMPMSEADKELAKTKYDFTEDTTPRSYEDHAKLLKGQSVAAKADDSGGVTTVPADSPFMKK